jgi:hypothetical protein
MNFTFSAVELKPGRILPTDPFLSVPECRAPEQNRKFYPSDYIGSGN